MTIAATTGSSMLLEALPAFVLVLGTPIAVWWWLSKGRRLTPGRLRVTDKAALGRNTWLAVVEIDDRRMLIGAGEHGVDLLSELEPQDEATEIVGNPEPTASRTLRLPNGFENGPGMGLLRRLQLMTLRSSTPPIARPGVPPS